MSAAEVLLYTFFKKDHEFAITEQQLKAVSDNERTQLREDRCELPQPGRERTASCLSHDY